ncbi:MAG: hypothetical protein WHV26_12535 [Spirochaetota bacterium]
MKITNSIPAVPPAQLTTNNKASVQIQQPVESARVYPSLKKAISAYTIISEAHQLVTMAINISYELIQKAFTPHDHNEILARIATINNYFTRLSPGSASVPNIPQSDTLQETTTIIEQLGTAIKNNDTALMNTIYDKLISHAQILDNTQKQIYMALSQPSGTQKPDINAIKSAIEQNQNTVFYAHEPLQYEHIQKLLA